MAPTLLLQLLFSVFKSLEAISTSTLLLFFVFDSPETPSTSLRRLLLLAILFRRRVSRGFFNVSLASLLRFLVSIYFFDVISSVFRLRFPSKYFFNVSLALLLRFLISIDFFDVTFLAPLLRFPSSTSSMSLNRRKIRLREFDNHVTKMAIICHHINDNFAIIFDIFSTIIVVYLTTSSELLSY